MSRRVNIFYNSLKISQYIYLFFRFVPQYNDSSVCSPICNPECINGICTAPDQCECLPDFGPTEENHKCDYICKGGCLNGKCIEGKCSCEKDWYGPNCSIFFQDVPTQ